VGPFNDPGALNLSEHADEGEHGSPNRRCEIERLPEGHEPDAQMLKLIEQRHQVAEIAPEAIERGHGNEIGLATTRVIHERIESGAALAGAADGGVAILPDDDPARTGRMLVEGSNLILCILVVGADAAVERDSFHGFLLVMVWCWALPMRATPRAVACCVRRYGEIPQGRAPGG